MPVLESPRFSCVVLFAERSAVDTRSRESKVASDVCFTDENSAFAFSMVVYNPFELGAKNSARESRSQCQIYFAFISEPGASIPVSSFDKSLKSFRKARLSPML